MARGAVDQARSVRRTPANLRSPRWPLVARPTNPRHMRPSIGSWGTHRWTSPTIPDMHCTYGPLKNIRSLIRPGERHGPNTRLSDCLRGHRLGRGRGLVDPSLARWPLVIFRSADLGDSQGVRPCHLPRGLRPSDLGLHGLPRAADEIRNCAAVRHYAVPDRGLRPAAGLTTARFPHGPAIGDFLPRGVRRPRVLLFRAFPA